jgi:hypothetical protein
MSHMEEQRTRAASEQKPVIAWEGLEAIVSSANPLGTADRYRELVKHFQLPWEAKMSMALVSWNSQRSRLAHGASRAEGKLEDLFHTSRIAGAINVVIGASLGYSGFAALSQIEDQYIMLA